MEWLAPIAVAGYLTHEGRVFVSPQFAIRDDKGRLWSCPDFVALNVPDREVWVVEVSTAGDIADLARKVNDRQNQWLEKLKAQLLSAGVIDDQWKISVKLFVRRDCIGALRKKVLDHQGVLIHAIEDVILPWRWPWGKTTNAAQSTGAA